MGLRDLLMNHGMAEGGLDLPDVLNALAKGAVLVDVRTAREYEAGHAPGARLVSPKELLADPFTAVYGDDPLAEPNPHFILVCDTGFRSGHLVAPVRERCSDCDCRASGLHSGGAGGEILIPGPPRGR